MKDQGYREFPLGREAYDYLTFKRKRLTDAAYREYEAPASSRPRAHGCSSDS